MLDVLICLRRREGAVRRDDQAAFEPGFESPNGRICNLRSRPGRHGRRNGVVFRGALGPWYSEEKREYHLHADAAANLVQGVTPPCRKNMNTDQVSGFPIFNVALELPAGTA